MTAILPEPAPGFHWTPAPWGLVLRCEALQEIAPHFFTARELQLRRREDDVVAEEWRREWDAVAKEIGVRPEALRRMRQVHGCTVITAQPSATPALQAPQLDSSPRNGRPRNGLRPNDAQPNSSPPHSSRPDGPQIDAPQVDGIVSADPDVALAVQVADCVPLLIADRRTGAVAATHAGWRGAAANIAAATVHQLIARFASRPSDLVAAIGPSIGPCCYQVGPEVKAAFQQGAASPRREEATNAVAHVDTVAQSQVDTWFRPDPGDGRGDRLKLDMWQANRDQLVAAGLLPERIHVARLCTASHVDRFHSYRVEGAATGRLLGVIRSRGPHAEFD